MRYHRPTRKDMDNLVSMLGRDKVFAGDGINEDFSHDELAAERRYPDVLIEASTAEEVSRVMKYASEHRIPVTPRGQGTGLVGSSVAVCGGIMLSLRRMNRILELDESNMTLTVEAGVLLMDIISHLDGTGCFYAPDPGEKSATIGGNINTNAGGMRAMKYGATRQNVLGLEVVYPNGDQDFIGGKIVKSSSGYSLKDMIIGSEGTLAVVTRAILRLLPVPKFSVTLLVPFPGLDKAIEAVPLIMRTRVVPTALEFTEQEAILNTERYIGRKFPHNTAPAYLILTFDGNSRRELEESYEQVAHKCLEAGAIDVFISNTPERNESIWSARGTFLEAIKASTTELDECDVVVPRDRIADFIKFSHALQKECNVQIRSFGHAGDGNLHIYVLRDDLDEVVWKETLKEVFDRLYSRTREIGGSVSGEHGIGYAKIPYLKDSLSSSAMRISRGIKEAFDPGLILNPGKIVEM